MSNGDDLSVENLNDLHSVNEVCDVTKISGTEFTESKKYHRC